MTQDYKHTIQARIASEPEFARALLQEVKEMIVNGELQTAQEVLALLLKVTSGSENEKEKKKSIAEGHLSVLKNVSVTNEDFSLVVKYLESRFRS